MRNSYYAIQKAVNEGKKEADIYIFGDIVTERWEEREVSAASLNNEIKDLDAELIRVHIDCYGGAVSEGWAIYNVLCEHPAKIITIADGFVASAAIFPFMAGDERIVKPLSAFYFHQVSMLCAGYAEDLRKAAEAVEKLTETGLKLLVEKTSMSEEEVRELMDNETWLTPEEALEKGIATKTEKNRREGQEQSARAQVVELLLKRREQQLYAPEPAPKSAFELIKGAFEKL